MSDEGKLAPRVFISYSWTTPQHEVWVEDLAKSLVQDGIDVILDKWVLKEGHDKYEYMESMVTDPSVNKVLMICDRAYKEKADSREGGVGTETQIISPELYAKTAQSKFVALIAEVDENGMPFLPVFYKTRIYIDLSRDADYTTGYDRLIRWAHDKPLHEKPPLGKMPEYLNNSRNLINSSASYRRTVDAIRNAMPNRFGLISEYFEIFIEGMADFKIELVAGEFDDLVVKSIDDFTPYRNEVLELLKTIARFEQSVDIGKPLHAFFERLLPFLYPDPESNTRREWDQDNYKFIVHELFLYTATILLQHERFDIVNMLLETPYYTGFSSWKSNELSVYSDFRPYLGSLEHRNRRLKLNRISLHADLLHKRSETTGIEFRGLMQADFVLYLRDSIYCLQTDGYQRWWPYTLLYMGWSGRGRGFEILAKSKSRAYFERAKKVLGISTKEEIMPFLEALNNRKLKPLIFGGGEYVDPAQLLNYDSIASLP